MRRYDAAPLSKVTRTPQGGLRVEGVLTRSGIFQYQTPSGPRREYRPPEEVFSGNALATFRGAPVTIGHPGLITPENYKDHTVGHVGDDVRQDGQHVVGTVNIQDADAIRKIESRELRELSCGYDVDLDETPGLANGERYDAVQRNIRGNHVALIPPGVGRAGREASLRLDSTGNEEPTKLEVPMADTKKPEQKSEAVQVRADQIDIHVDGQQEIEKLRAENEVLKAKVEELSDTKRFDSAVADRVALVSAAVGVLGASYVAEGQTARQIKEAVVKVRNPKLRLDSTRSDDFVDAAYEMALQFVDATHPSLGKVRQDAKNATEVVDPINTSEAKNASESRDAWKRPLAIVNPLHQRAS